MNASPETEAQIRARVLALLVGIAPDVDAATVRPDLDFRDQFDFDSMDLFNFASAVHAAYGIDIPEKDYRELAGLDRCVRYLGGRLGR